MRLEQTITPRFFETDALGHINNTILVQWFELAREPLFKIFTPDLDPKKWRLIIARCEVDFLDQIHYGYDVLVQTYLSKIGNSSMIVEHLVFQKDLKVAKGKAVMIHFDYEQQKSVAIPESEREQLAIYLEI